MPTLPAKRTKPIKPAKPTKPIADRKGAPAVPGKFQPAPVAVLKQAEALAFKANHPDAAKAEADKAAMLKASLLAKRAALQGQAQAAADAKAKAQAASLAKKANKSSPAFRVIQRKAKELVEASKPSAAELQQATMEVLEESLFPGTSTPSAPQKPEPSLPSAASDFPADQEELQATAVEVGNEVVSEEEPPFYMRRGVQIGAGAVVLFGAYWWYTNRSTT